MKKPQVFQDAIDFVHIGEETRRAFQPKKKNNNNKSYKRQINRIKKSLR